MLTDLEMNMEPGRLIVSIKDVKKLAVRLEEKNIHGASILHTSIGSTSAAWGDFRE